MVNGVDWKEEAIPSCNKFGSSIGWRGRGVPETTLTGTPSVPVKTRSVVLSSASDVVTLVRQNDYMNVDHLSVGIRELKAKLSEYVASVSEGGRVTVTDRGRPVAELVPISGPSQLDRGIETGWVDPPRRTSLREPLLFESRRSIADVLDDDRGA